MRADNVAEWILSLVMPRDRARAVVGDLVEEAAAQQRPRFWMCVARTALAFLGRNLTTAPLRLAGFAVAGWVVYMMVSVILLPSSFVLAPALAWAAKILTEHTGLELVAAWLRVPPGSLFPEAAVRLGVELLIMLAVAPLLVGRFTARWWPGREIAACVMVALVWPFLAFFAPFVAISTRLTLPMVPIVAAFVLAGALWERRESTTPTTTVN
jgi:hypothetical protein